MIAKLLILFCFSLVYFCKSFFFVKNENRPIMLCF